MNPDDGRELVTQAEGGRRLGITPPAIGKWAAKPGAPLERRGNRTYLIWPDFPRWRDAQLAGRGSDEAKARTALLKVRRDRERLRLRRERGELVSVEAVRDEYMREVLRLRQILLSWPQQAAWRAVGVKTEREAFAVLTMLRNDLMRELAGLTKKAGMKDDNDEPGRSGEDG